MEYGGKKALDLFFPNRVLIKQRRSSRANGGQAEKDFSRRSNDDFNPVTLALREILRLGLRLCRAN